MQMKNIKYVHFHVSYISHWCLLCVRNISTFAGIIACFTNCIYYNIKYIPQKKICFDGEPDNNGDNNSIAVSSLLQLVVYTSTQNKYTRRFHRSHKIQLDTQNTSTALMIIKRIRPKEG